MRWWWQKKPEPVVEEPTQLDFILPAKDSVAACPKCGARSLAGFGLAFHGPRCEWWGRQESCCFAASGIFNGTKHYLAHLSRTCPRCSHRWHERPLDWAVAE